MMPLHSKKLKVRWISTWAPRCTLRFLSTFEMRFGSTWGISGENPLKSLGEALVMQAA